MKLVFFKSTPGVCVALVFLSFLFACQKPDIVGMEVQPANDKLNVEHCNITLNAYSVKEDSIRTDETVNNLLGYIYDPVFGKTSASFYTQIRLSVNNTTFGTNPVIADAIVLSLPYKGIYGDTSSQQTVNVYELAEDIYKDSSYYSNREFLTTGISLGTKTFIPAPKDSVFILGDTLPPQLRIPLSKNLATKFINNTGSLTDNSTFLKFFKGIYITTTSVVGNGAIMSFDLLNSQSKVTLYYHNNNSTDTLAYDFPINGDCARINHFNHSKYYYANSYLRSEIYGDTLKGDSILYLQSMAGLKIRILYPYLKDLVKHGRIAINKANLVVAVDNNDMQLTNYTPPSQLVLLEEQDGLIRFLVDQNEGMTYYGGAYNSSKKEYRFNIARHIQQVVDGIKDNLGLYLVDWTSSRPNEATGVVLKGPKRHTGNLRLQITYTKLY